jgi:hypothetical protein
LAKSTSSQLPPKRPLQQRLKQMLHLAFRFALLGAQPLEFVSDLSGDLSASLQSLPTYYTEDWAKPQQAKYATTSLTDEIDDHW